MPVPPSFEASTSSPYIYQQEFAKRQQVYQRQAALTLNRNRISSNNQGNIASSGKLRIYPKEVSKSPQPQQQQAQEVQKPKGLINTSPLLSAFTNPAGNFTLGSTSPPISATPPPIQLSSSPQLQPYNGSPQLQPYNGSPQLQPYNGSPQLLSYAGSPQLHNFVQQIPQGQPAPTIGSYSTPSSLPNELPTGSGSPGNVVAHSLPGGGGYRSPYNPVSYPPLSDNLYQVGPSHGHAPALGFLLGSKSGTRSPTGGKAGNACSFDVLDDLETLKNDFNPFGSSTGTITGTDVVCQGWEGGVDVWKVGRGVVELVARLEGLSGSVVGAKILPSLPRDDTTLSMRPLICLTIHSPVVSRNRENAAVGASPSERPGSSHSHASASSEQQQQQQPRPTEVASEYQTTVELYSLSQRMRIATLFKSSPIPVQAGIGVAPPPPLRIRVEASAIPGQGNLVVVGVAGSGELYVYGSSKIGAGLRKRMSQLPDEFDSTGWKCIAKLWTNVQSGPRQEAAASELATGLPIFFLESRWLAYLPPRSGATSRGGDVTVRCTQALPPSPPSQPSTNTYVDVPEEEPILNRVAREVTQEVIRGAKWVGEHGMRAVKSYWNGYNSGLSGTSPPQAAAGGVRVGPAPGGSNGVSLLGMQVRDMRERERELASLGPGGAIGAPPEGGLATPPGFHHSDPVVVSLIDLGKPFKPDAPPLCTFQPPLGVSFLSMAPGGLVLLTASQKGDVVLAWDLLKAVHHPSSVAPKQSSAKASSLQSQVGSPDGLSLPVTNGRLPSGQYAGRHVRQIARFTRMTVAHIVDVSWSSPRGDKLAVVTDNRTVHFFDMPVSAFQWPPPKRAIPPPSSQGGVGGMVNTAGQAAASLLATTQPLVVAARRRRSSGSSASATAASSGKENGFHGYGSGTNSAGNKISLPSAAGASKGCVRFLGKEQGYVAMIGGGVLRIYESRKQGGGGRKKSSYLNGGVMTQNWTEYELPKPPDGVATGIVSSEPLEERNANEITDEQDIAEMLVLPGIWNGKPPPGHGPQSPRMKDHVRQYHENPLSYAEIEVCPPRPPLHNDRHITLSVFSGPPATHSIASLSKNTTWVFGQPVQADKLDVGAAKGEVEFKNGSDGLAVTEAMESVLRLEDDGDNPDDKVTTARTRRKKGKKAVTSADLVATGGRPGEEFEEGFEVIESNK